MTKQQAEDYNIILRNGDLVVDSLTVAEKFDRKHKNVLQDIKAISQNFSWLKSQPSDFDNQFEMDFEDLFYEGTYQSERGRTYPLYYMNQKGFTLLVMSYTGLKAFQYKLAYIEQFERMRQELLTGNVNRPLTLTEFIREGLKKRPPLAKIDWEDTEAPDHYCFGIWGILQLYGYSKAITMSFLREVRPLVVNYGLPYFEEVVNYCAAKDKLRLGYVLKVLEDYHPSEVEQMVDEPVFGISHQSLFPIITH